MRWRAERPADLRSYLTKTPPGEGHGGVFRFLSLNKINSLNYDAPVIFGELLYCSPAQSIYMLGLIGCNT